MSPAAARIASRWLTFEEAKVALKCGDDVLRRLLISRSIYGRKIGKEWRVDAESIVAYLNAPRDRARVAFEKFRK